MHVYGIDCGSNALLPLIRMPHVGAVVSRDEPDRARRLINRLLVEIARRQQLLAAEGASSAAEQRAGAAPRTGCRGWCSSSTAGRGSCPPSRATTTGSSSRWSSASSARARPSASRSS
ncbi:FtsK/SpoIIIE domain-containing protein [Actinomadura keratinilytica]